MAERITQRDLEKCAGRLNELTGKDYVIGGYCTKRELWVQMGAYLMGMKDIKEVQS